MVFASDHLTICFHCSWHCTTGLHIHTQ